MSEPDPDVLPDPDALNVRGCREILTMAVVLWIIIIASVRACWPS